MVTQEHLKALKEGEQRGRKHFFIITNRDNPKIGDVIGVQPAVARTYMRRDLPPVKKGEPAHSLMEFSNFDKERVFPIKFANINSPGFLERVKYLRGFRQQESYSDILDSFDNIAAASEEETPEKKRRGRQTKQENAFDESPTENNEAP